MLGSELLRGALVALVVVMGCAAAGEDDSGGDDGDNMMGMCGSCAAPNQCCELSNGSFCIAVDSDMSNCGGCGNQCNLGKADRCQNGMCSCGFAPACGDSTTCCDTGCKDLLTDDNNCGACGVQCTGGTSCSGGVCLCGGVACGPGEMCCGGTCVNTQMDPANCGACGMVCTGELSACSAGQCACPQGGPACAMDAILPTCCDTGCADLCTDVNNCGMCGAACPAGDTCFLGACFSDPDGEPMFECFGFPSP